MAGMRVHELAKEYGISSKEMLERLAEADVNAKSHASILSSKDVEKVKEKFPPEVKEETTNEEEPKSRIVTKQELAHEKKERALKAAGESEHARRVVEKVNELDAQTDVDKTKDQDNNTKEAPSEEKSSFESLEQQIEHEKERAKRERELARARKLAAERTRKAAKTQAVEQALRARQMGKKAVEETAKAVEETVEAEKKVVTNKVKPRFGSLLDQIESEKKRITEEREADKKQKAAAKKNKPSGDSSKKAANKPANKSAKPAPSKAGKAKKQPKDKNAKIDPIIPELNNAEPEGEDRYAKMAVQAEKLQRDKVLSEARAAVRAAMSHEGEGRRKKRKEKREAEAREKAAEEAIERGIDPDLVLDDSVVEVPQGATVTELAELLEVQPNDIIKRLFMLGQVLTVTQSMNDDLLDLVADDLGRKIRIVSPEEEFTVVYNDKEEDLKPRSPVVTVMGHVDHGKTSTLDAIRNTGVAGAEAGGITQHIGASVVTIDGRQITFIDTPGHEAFTAMRARGAQVTDVIVLVVAADDGVMPQTIEAINHAKAADVPIVVAVNKVDKPGANPDRVRQELTEYGVIPEEWGGTNMFVNISAKKHLYIDELLETILLQADILELKANPDTLASGFVIESNLDKGRGPIATVLVQRGTLRQGDTVVAGTSHGRARALVNSIGKTIKEAGPSEPVEIVGLNSVPTAGDEFRVFEDERAARKLAEERALRERVAEQNSKSHMSLDDLFNRIAEDKQADLNLIVKADVQGSIEALRDAFDKMDQSEVHINIVHSAVGGITETDVTLATASDAIIIGFNVRPTGKSRQLAEKEKVDIRLYRVIYQAIEDINAARVGLLSPDIVEEDTGIAEVRELFKVPKIGTVAGCYMLEGEMHRDDQVRLVRDGTVIFEGKLASMRRFKDDVKSVKSGYECGLGVEGYQDLKIGDTLEGFVIKEVERTE